MNSDITPLDQLPSDPSINPASLPPQMQPNITMNIQEQNPSQKKVSFSDIPEMQSQQMNYNPNVQGVMDPSGSSQAPQFHTYDANAFQEMVKKEASSGGLGLPSNAMGMNPFGYSGDTQTTPNYVPSSNRPDFVNNPYTQQQYIMDYQKGLNQKDNTDLLFDELKIPVLIGLLFFIFQLPFFKAYLSTHLPMIVMVDGNFNFYGYITTTILFVFVFYSLMKMLDVYKYN